MALVKKPIIHDWMSYEQKLFREKTVWDLIKNKTAFGKRTFMLVGFFDNGIQSVVALLSQGNSRYVLKLNEDSSKLELEYHMLKLLDANGIPSIKPLELLDFGSHKGLLLEFVKTPRTYLSTRPNTSAAITVATQIGKILANLHKIKLPGYGQLIIQNNKLKGKYDNYDLQLDKFNLENLTNSKYEEYCEKLDLVKIANYQKTVVKSGRLCHLDLGIHNMFGIRKVKIFDGSYESNNPLFDFGISYLWFSYLGDKAKETLLKSYKMNVDYFNEEIFNQCLLLATLHKLNKWLKRAESETKVMSWIKTAEDILKQYTKAL